MAGESRPILIIGAGVSGLCLASGLRKNTALPLRVFEKDSSLHARSQGYRFRVSGEGIGALKHNLSPEGYERVLANACAYVHDGSTHNSIDNIVDGMTGGAGRLDGVWKADESSKAKFHKHLGEEDDKPLSIDRGVLRQVLWEEVSHVVEFDKKLLRYELTTHGTVNAHFADNSVVEGSALIGADGCYSHARSTLLPSYILKDSEARVIWGKAELTDDFVAALPPLARSGLGLFTTPDLKVLFESMHFDHSRPHLDGQLVPKDYFYYLCYPRKESLFGMDEAEFLHLTNDEAGELAKKLTQNWDISARVPFERVAPQAASVSQIPTATPEIPTWDDQGPVTLMGDAVHSMAPTAALGATTALRDALHLSQQLQRIGPEMGSAEVINALRQYESQMRVYAAQALQLSAAGGRVVFGFRGFDVVPKIELHR